jgi:hypothetical protein
MQANAFSWNYSLYRRRPAANPAFADNKRFGAFKVKSASGRIAHMLTM